MPTSGQTAKSFNVKNGIQITADTQKYDTNRRYVTQQEGTSTHLQAEALQIEIMNNTILQVMIHN